MDVDGKWQQTWIVPPQFGRTPFTGVCAGLAVAAGGHAERLGFGLAELHARHLTWMLSRFLVRLDREVPAGETLHVTTWPAGAQRLFALREFTLAGPDGDRIGAGRSAWFLIDLATRRPIDPAPHVGHLARTERALDTPLDRVGDAFQTHGPLEVHVTPADIDANGHVTFTSYIAWIERALLTTHGRPLRQLEINYLAEVFPDQAVRVDLGPAAGDDGLWVAEIQRPEDGEAVARARARLF